MHIDRDDAALQILTKLWDIYFSPALPFTDERFQELTRDSFVLADKFLEISKKHGVDLFKVGKVEKSKTQETANGN